MSPITDKERDDFVHAACWRGRLDIDDEPRGFSEFAVERLDEYHQEYPYGGSDATLDRLWIRFDDGSEMTLYRVAWSWGFMGAEDGDADEGSLHYEDLERARQAYAAECL